MKKQIKNLSTLCLFLLLSVLQMEAQIGVNNTNSDPDPSAMLDVQSTDKGVLIPRMTSIQRDAIQNPVAGLMIYNLEDSCFNYFTGAEWVKDCGRKIGLENIPGSKQLEGTGNESGTGITTDASGNIYTIGTFDEQIMIDYEVLFAKGSLDSYMAKYDSSGNLIWIRQMGESGVAVNANAIELDASGNIFITGGFEGTVTFDTASLNSAGGFDLFLVKYDTEGNILWAKESGGAGPDYGKGISTDNFGNVFVVGTSNTDAILFKYDSNGSLLWSRLGVGSGYEGGTDIATDPFGNVIIIGSTGSSWFTFDSISFSTVGYQDLYVAKFNTNGDVLWIRQGGNPSTYCNGSGLSTDATGNIYISGVTSGSIHLGGVPVSPQSGGNVIGKFDPDGGLIWGEMWPGVDNEWVGLDTDLPGNVYFTGSFRSTKSFGSSSTSLTSVGDRDILTVKYDTNGNIIWAKKAGGINDDNGLSIAVNTSGNVFVTGYFTDEATIGNKSYSGVNKDAFLWMLQGGNGDPMIIESNNFAHHQSLFNDQDPTNEFQDLSFLGSELSIENGNTLDLSSVDNQTLTLSGTTLSIANGNSVDLVGIDTDTDDQALSISGNNLSIDDGNTIGLSSAVIDSQILSLSGTTLSISNGNSVDLASIDTDTDDQTLSINGNTLQISNGNTVNLGGVGVDSQMLSISGNILTLSGGNNVDLSGIDTDTDDQTISLAGNDLTISDGNTVDIAALNTDAQNLNLSGITLSITGGNSLDLQGFSDDLGNHSATQNITLGNNYLSGDGDDEGIWILANGNVGLGTHNPAHLLHSKTAGSSNLEYALELQNPYNPLDAATGILFSANDASNEGKGALVYHGTSAHGAGDFMFLQKNYALPGNPTLNDAVMIIKHNGDVGIGTVDPAEKLHVSGVAQLQGDNTKIRFSSEETTPVFSRLRSEIHTNINPTSSINPVGAGDNTMTFHVSNNETYGMEEVLKLQGDGNIGIGDIDSAQAHLELSEVLPEIRLTDTRSGSSSFWSEGTVLGRLGFHARGPLSGNYRAVGSIDMVTDDGTTHPDGRLEFRTSQNGTVSTKMSINSEGRVGIGTTSPQTFLHVAGNGRTTNGQGRYFDYTFGDPGPTSSTTSRSDVVAYFEGDMIASAGVTSMNVTSWSDARAKEIIQRSDSREDLKLLKQIQITDYRWIDTLEDQGRIQKKIIAQEIEKILPNSVSRMRKAIPNVYQKAIEVEYDEVKEELTLFLTKNHDFEVGDKVRVFTDTEDLEEIEVVAIGSASSFTISAKPANNAFVYGKWVDDYRKVDYDALSMLNISATQEQQQLIESQAKEIDNQKQIIEHQLKTLESLSDGNENRKEKIKALKARFETIETLILDRTDQK